MLSLFDFWGYSVQCITDEEWNPQFNLKDICNVLWLRERRVLANDEYTDCIKQLTYAWSPNVATTFINEEWLYWLLWLSKNAIVKPFRKRVTHEVLPSIRKHWSYSTNRELQFCIENKMFFVDATYVIIQKVHRVLRDNFPDVYKSKFNNIMPRELYWNWIKEIPLSNKPKYQQLYVTPFTDIMKFFGIESLQPNEWKFVFDTCCIGSIYEWTVSDSVYKTLSIK